MVIINSSRQAAPLAVSICFILVVSISVTLRVWAKHLKKVSLALDDHLIFTAAIFVYGLITCDIIGVTQGGVGRHVTQVIAIDGPGPLTVFAKDLVAIQMLWALSLMFTKLSILSFYVSIFSTQFFKRAAYAVAVVVVLWALSVVLCGFLLCRPFAFNWDTTIPGGKCTGQIKSYIITGALNITTDVLVLALPLPMVWKLHASRSNKVALTGIFTLGFFICIISVLRMKSLLTVSYTDITYSVVDALIWSMLEPALGIALACMPIIRPLFSKIFPDRLTSRSKSKTSSKNSMLAPKGDAKNFQRIQDQSGYALGPLRPDNMTSTYDTHLKSHQEDIESQTSLRSESELVLPASRIKVKSDWKISTNEA